MSDPQPSPPSLAARILLGLTVAAKAAVVVLAFAVVALLVWLVPAAGALAVVGVLAAIGVLATAPFGEKDLSLGAALLVGFVLAFALAAVAIASL